MNSVPIKLPKVRKGDDLMQLLDASLPSLAEGSIVAISSKVISLCEGRVAPYHVGASKAELVQKEADAYLINEHGIPGLNLTIKEGMLIPAAGIDESNSADGYVLYPAEPMQSARVVWEYLRHKHSIKQCGVVITDSTVRPLRRGVIGIGIAWCGFNGIYDYRGQPDCFGRPMQVTCINNVDALAAIAVFTMGEGAEQTPVAIITNAPRIEFKLTPPDAKEVEQIRITMEEDLYAPLFNHPAWHKTRM